MRLLALGFALGLVAERAHTWLVAWLYPETLGDRMWKTVQRTIGRRGPRG